MGQVPAAQAEGELPRRVRGPSHQRPILLRWTALSHLLTRLLILAVFPIAGLCVMVPTFPRISLVIIGIATAISGTFWLIAASRVGCRICAMRMFFSKSCAKNRKAPSWLFFGPHNTLAIRSLYAKSVRCPYCGTPNELSTRGDD